MNDIEFIYLTHVQQHLSGDLKHRKKIHTFFASVIHNYSMNRLI